MRTKARAHSHLPVCPDTAGEPLLAAHKLLEQSKTLLALSCAAKATALYPDDPEAHLVRADALAELGHVDEAGLALARVLALDPEHLDGLLLAAHFYAVTMLSSREHDELGFTYAERGRRLAVLRGDAELVREFSLVGAMALNDLGEAALALERAEGVLAEDPRRGEAAFERALALFERCRFDDARSAFAALLEDKERAASAHHHLALLLERQGLHQEAETYFRKAHTLSPEDFPKPVILSGDAFEAEVAKALKGLPSEMREDLKGVPIVVEDLPLATDLLSGEPPLSPTILGLFRGPPLSEPCFPADLDTPTGTCRSIVLYRLNLGRAVRSRAELNEQIRVTLLHELGHLRGEDDFELAARGLE